jgi:pimeloyl-ACP methyl ester carboxylesterase
MSLRRLAAGVTAVAMVVLAAAPAEADPQPRVITGTAAGVPFTVELPAHWNGTLLLWSHWYAVPGQPAPPPNFDDDHPELKAWLLDHGYALAGSQFPMALWTTREMVTDQLAVLDAFTTKVGRPRHTIAWGKSLGGQVTAVLAERHPDRIDAALPMCGNVAGAVGPFNAMLDASFALATLQWPDQPVQLVHLTDPATNQDLANGLLRAAVNSPDGMARIALASAFAGIPGWEDSLVPRPTDPAEAAINQYLDLRYQLGPFLFGAVRAQAETILGGNPSWNAGVDYAAQLARSPRRAQVEELYRRAGLDLNADLARLAAAPRIGPDVPAVARMARDSTMSGLVGVPTLTLHSTGDGTDPASAERWYGDHAAALHRSGNLRQAFVDRANHCFFTAAEELAALGALTTRLDTGRWGDTSAAALNTVADSYGPEYRTMWSYYSEGTAAVAGGYTATRPERMARPFPF